jgi:hypothetical protein
MLGYPILNFGVLAPPLLLSGIFDVGDNKLEPAVFGDLDALDVDAFLARTTDGALKIAATEVDGNAGHVDGLLFFGAVRRRFIFVPTRIIFVNQS